MSSTEKALEINRDYTGLRLRKNIQNVSVYVSHSNLQFNVSTRMLTKPHLYALFCIYLLI